MQICFSDHAEVHPQKKKEVLYCVKILGENRRVECSAVRIRVGLLMLSSKNVCIYTCQLFLRYKRDIFILGVLGFLKTTRSFPKIPEEVRSLPKTSKVC